MSVRLDATTHEALLSTSNALGKSANAIVNDALTEYLGRPEVAQAVRSRYEETINRLGGAES